MISIAKDNYEKDDGSLSFSTGDFRTYEDDNKYNAVISLFHVVSYQNKNEDVISSFMTANKVLEKGGIFIFDLWYGPGVVNQLPENRIRKVEDDNNTIIRFASPYIHWNENVVDVNYEVFVVNKCSNTVSMINETHKMRYFFKPEIENMLNLAGFKLLSCLDCNTLHETDEKSWTAYFIAKKIGEI